MSGERTTTVLVGVTGGIAAYKSCELVRALMKRGYRVKVVMTEAATRFVTPLTFRTLTNEPVAVSLWEDDPSAPVHHISLAEEADVFVIAPCTANVIAKIAQGRADDLLTTAALATEAPIVLAPAMNVHMWRDEATQENVQVLRDRGVVFVEPDSGELACGDAGIATSAMCNDLANAVIAFHGSPEQQERFLGPFVGAPLLASFCLTEPGAGSDNSAMTTFIRKEESGGYRLNGTKCFITNASHASQFTVFCKLEKP
ncbi:MAG: Phosphopantothenoylcysteine decarboxylase/phosphopantothenate/cysteine ligase, partial [Actinobacteria bacterium 66_15]